MKRNYEKFITDMIRYASSAESPDYIIQQIIKYICENLDSDRAYIFEDNLDGTFRNTYEWCREVYPSKLIIYSGCLMRECWMRGF